MYNWSVDEKAFKNTREVINFLKEQPEVINAWALKQGKGKTIIQTKLSRDIHPAGKFLIAKMIQERSDRLNISVVEK